MKKVWLFQTFFVSLYHNLKIKNMKKLNNIIIKIEELENESFEGWTQEEINGYLTACATIKNVVEQMKKEITIDNKE